MSLGGGSSKALDDAVNRGIVTDLHFAVTEKAVTVGASTLADERAYLFLGSTHSICVDDFCLAPRNVDYFPQPTFRGRLMKSESP